jgi:hypothetical protein
VLAFQSLLLGAWMSLFARRALLESVALWRQSVVAGLLGALAERASVREVAGMGLVVGGVALLLLAT